VFVTADAFIASLKLATIFTSALTPVAPFKGVTDVTTSGIISPASVVNDKV
jgi:hypothetical protein